MTSSMEKMPVMRGAGHSIDRRCGGSLDEGSLGTEGLRTVARTCDEIVPNAWVRKGFRWLA